MLNIFDGVLTERDWKRHLSHTFEVPDGATRLFIRLRFDPPVVDGIANMLCLSLFDPNGFRGAGHRGGAQHDVVIDGADATPGYLPGPLPAGVWDAVIDTHMVVPGTPCRYTLEIQTTDEPVAEPLPSPAPPSVKTPGRGWYRGDLHAHTIHSDGEWDILALLEAARARRLDFVTLTDHNTISQLRHIDALTTNDLLVMGGMELTTFWGHALSLGTRRWIDWRIRPSERSMPQIAADIEKEGGLFVIAHPLAPGDPYCTGCDWRYVEMMPGTARAVEVWNGLWHGDSNNEAALALWYEWLNWGLHLTATAGTDAHGQAPPEVRPGFNVVYAAHRNESAILRAIAHGRLYLSSGPVLELTGMSGETHTMIGGTLPRGAATIHARWCDVPANARLRLIANGAQLSEDIATPEGERTWNLEEGAAQWCVAEIRAADGEMLAVTNPIYFAPEE